jgi:hypothetical protein
MADQGTSLLRSQFLLCLHNTRIKRDNLCSTKKKSETSEEVAANGGNSSKNMKFYKVLSLKDHLIFSPIYGRKTKFSPLSRFMVHC